MRGLAIAALVARCSIGHTEPLRPLADDVVASLAGAAARGALALVESKADGTMRQVTLIVFVRAPAQVVHDVVADVGGYLRFVPNLKEASFRHEADGQWVNTWRLELPIATFSGRDAYEIDPAPLGPVRFHSLHSLATYAWSFVPTDGTLLVQAGYADVLHANRFVRAFVRRQPALEHGLGLAAQYMIVSAVQAEAQRRAGAAAIATPRTRAGALERLAERGQVVLMRADPGGRLEEVSAIERMFAGEARVREVIADPAAYREFIAGVDESAILERSGRELTYRTQMAIPIVTWATTYRMRVDEHAIDGAATEGDLRGARYRWDLQARGAAETLVTYRVSQPLARASILVRKLFEVDPSLEHGLNVAFALLQLRSVRGRAEGWQTK